MENRSEVKLSLKIPGKKKKSISGRSHETTARMALIHLECLVDICGYKKSPALEYANAQQGDCHMKVVLTPPPTHTEHFEGGLKLLNQNTALTRAQSEIILSRRASLELGRIKYLKEIKHKLT